VKTQVAIIGASPTRRYAPWADDNWTFLAINEIAQPRYDIHFELHPRRVQSAQDLAWLAQCTAPCYVLDPGEWAEGEIPQPVRFPLEWILEVTGGRRYFTCTFAMQIAWALAEGYTEIGLWGIDLDLGTHRERLVEKPCVEYWLGLAEGRGVKITLPRESTMLHRPYVYGLDYENEKANVERVVEDFGLGQTWWTEILDRLGFRYQGDAAEAEVHYLRIARAVKTGADAVRARRGDA